MERLKIAVIGAGGAGMLAAGRAAAAGADVTLFEKNSAPGKKLLLTGKGRCNLTNCCEVREFIENVPTNPRFLYAAVNRFTPRDTMDFFEGLGVALKVERGNRVFPVSDKSRDVVNALYGYVKSSGCRVVNERVTKLVANSGAICGIETERDYYSFSRVIVATGGASYPLTGSTGDGYRFARRLGIEVTKLSPSLVPLETIEKWCAALQGLSLKNVGVKVFENDIAKPVYEDFGELMFTHFGITGPTVMSASAHLKDIVPAKYRFVIDLKPALDEATLDKRLLTDFQKYHNKNFSNALCDLLPSKLIGVFVTLCGVPAEKKVNALTKEERYIILHLLKNLTLTIKRTRPIEEAIITSGGVSVKELDPRTMECKKIRGLFFAGEVIDVDAYTGGFNLQVAFATAVCAADAASAL